MTSSPPAPPPASARANATCDVVWHPCTQMKDHEWLPLTPIERGEGAWLYGYDGRRYLDAISSWWVNLFGHANPRINAAITDSTRQARARAPGGVHPRACGATGRAAHAPGSAWPDALLLRGQRVECDRSRAQDELPLLAQPGPDAQEALHHAVEQLSRRDARRAGSGATSSCTAKSTSRC